MCEGPDINLAIFSYTHLENLAQVYCVNYLYIIYVIYICVWEGDTVASQSMLAISYIKVEVWAGLFFKSRSRKVLFRTHPQNVLLQHSRKKSVTEKINMYKNCIPYFYSSCQDTQDTIRLTFTTQ